MNRLNNTVTRFVLVGIVNTLVGMTIMFALYNLAGCSYWISSGTNYFLTSILSYILNKRFTFRHTGDRAGSAIRFAINIALCYLLAYGIAKPLTFAVVRGSIELRENIAMLVGMCIFTGLNYLGQRLFAFRKGETK
jgi:putative flippase GtrA